AEANGFSPIFQLLLPFTSSAFVRTDSMLGAVRWLAKHQPFTVVIDTLRGLLSGTPIGNSAVLAVVRCVGPTLVGYLWARALYTVTLSGRRASLAYGPNPFPRHQRTDIAMLIPNAPSATRPPRQRRGGRARGAFTS